MPDPTATAPPVEAIDRALVLLETLASAGPGGLSLAELATTTGLNKTTLHRALAALRHRGFADQDPSSGTYALGAAAVGLGDAFLREDNLPGLLHPALLALSRAAGELVHLGVLVGTSIVYLDKVEPERSVRVVSAIGRRNPAVTTALGRALLAARGVDRDAFGAYTVGHEDIAERAWNAVRAARTRGYAVEDRENEPDIACVAVALVRAGAPVAAVSVTAPAARMGAERAAELYGEMTRVLPPLLPAGIALAG